MYNVGTDTVTKTLAASSNATVAGTLAVTGAITASAAIKTGYQLVSSTATAITNYGITVMSSTVAGHKRYKMTAPSGGGIQKDVWVKAISGSSARRDVVGATSGVLFYTTDGLTSVKLNLGAVGTGVTLVSLTTAAWMVTNNNGVTSTTTYATT